MLLWSIGHVHSTFVLLLFRHQSLYDLWVQIVLTEEVVNILDLNLLDSLFPGLPLWRHIPRLKYWMFWTARRQKLLHPPKLRRSSDKMLAKFDQMRTDILLTIFSMIHQKLIYHLGHKLTTWWLGYTFHYGQLILSKTPNLLILDTHQESCCIDIIFEWWHEISSSDTSFMQLLLIRYQEVCWLEWYLSTKIAHNLIRVHRLSGFCYL